MSRLWHSVARNFGVNNTNTWIPPASMCGSGWYNYVGDIFLAPIGHLLPAVCRHHSLARGPFCTRCTTVSDGYFQLDNIAYHKAPLFSNWILMGLNTKQCPQYSQHNSLDCGKAEHWHEGCSVDKSAGTPWCCHTNVNQNVSRHVFTTKN